MKPLWPQASPLFHQLQAQNHPIYHLLAGYETESAGGGDRPAQEPEGSMILGNGTYHSKMHEADNLNHLFLRCPWGRRILDRCHRADHLGRLCRWCESKVSAEEWDAGEERDEWEELEKMSGEELIAHTEAELALETLNLCGWGACSEEATNRGFCPQHRKTIDRIAKVAAGVFAVAGAIGVVIVMVWLDIP